MTPQELKNSILQLAIQGKLVEQRPEEGNAEELYKKIQAEKQALVKAGKIKKEKALPEIAEDEIPFEIPQNWKWVRVRDCISNRSGLSYKKDNLDLQSEKMVRVLRGGNIIEMGYTLKHDDVMISEDFVKPELFLTKNTIITPAVTSLDHVGKMGRIEKDYSDVVVGGFVLMLTPHLDNDVFSSYLLYALSSKYFRNCCREIVNKSGQAFYNLSREKMMALLLPLPPLSEQRRIVSKLDELLPLCDRYGESWSRLEELNKRFPGEMRRSLLQMAIQGKLVEQRHEEGNAQELYKKIQAEKQELIKAGKIKKDKALPEIAEEEIPFEIPENWMWVYIGDIFRHNTGKAQNSSGSIKGEIRKFITTSNLYWNRFDFSKIKEMPFTEQELERCLVKKGDLLVCEGGDCGRSAIWNYDEEVCIQNHVHRLRPYVEISIEYFYYLFYLYKHTGRLRGHGVGIQGLSSKVMNQIICPLPPLSEQRRIVSRLEELLPLCDRLK